MEETLARRSSGGSRRGSMTLALGAPVAGAPARRATPAVGYSPAVQKQ